MAIASKAASETKGSRIYDPKNGKTCHQCRKKTMDIMARCKNKKKDKQCTIQYCHKCLLIRYGEKTEEVSVVEDWFCPKCRGICNCSFCREKNDKAAMSARDAEVADSTNYQEAEHR